MAEEENEQGAAKKEGGLNIVGLLITAVLAGGAGFAGSVMSMPSAETSESDAKKALPGESIPLDSFVLTLSSEEGDTKAAKVKLTIELQPETTADAFQVFVPRVRDALLNYLRSQTYEALSDTKRHKVMGKEMLDAIHKVGGKEVAAVLIQDLVVQ